METNGQGTRPDVQSTAGGPEATIRAYLQAVAGWDVVRCVAFFADDARIELPPGVFEGKQAIAEFHRERFAAELKLVRIGAIRATGDTVHVEAVVTSKLIRAVKIGALPVRGAFRVEHDKIKEVRGAFAPPKLFGRS
jgi:limonene-1,2-epoxide hydrolase